jgi:YHYH protein
MDKHLAGMLVLALFMTGCGGSGASAGSVPAASATSTAAATTSTGSYTCPAAATSSGTLNCAALPLGDSKYSTTAPGAGAVFVCNVPNGQAPSATGPWINTAAGTWNALSKDIVSGSVSWSGSFNATVSGASLDITGNGLPLAGITTGTFPIASTDAVYQYDGNPNHIASQSLNYALPYNPVAAASPGCLSGGRIGVAINGVSIFDALDAVGHDAVAREGQDSCHGHPDQSSTYHYHGWLFACVADSGSVTQNSSLLGYALDGYGIYGPWYNGKILTTADLDQCHGTSSVVSWHGASVSIYHYVSTYDFPYTLGCYHGTAVPA